MDSESVRSEVRAMVALDIGAVSLDLVSGEFRTVQVFSRGKVCTMSNVRGDGRESVAVFSR